MNAAAEARNTGEPVAMAPMHPRERRLVHLEIETLDDLVTYTAEGEDGKYVVICREDQVPAKYRDGAYGGAPATDNADTADTADATDAADTADVVDTDESADTDDHAGPAASAAVAGAETAAVITDDAEEDLDDDDDTRRDED